MNANNKNNHANNTKTSEQLFNEAPASWNTRYVDASGFECQLTLRAESGSELLEKASHAIAYLLENGCTPSVFYRGGPRQPEAKEEKTSNGKGNGQSQEDGNPAWCPIHECEMKRWEKDGRVWYSHKADGSWCRGK